ncbi:MAG: hypothetical protein K5984_01290 [Bacteroidales bacterium]|nr:hypothetical protein [Bacteroidales bacterium]
MIKSIFSSPKLRLPLPTVDVHSHILPGVDDGFQRVEDSVEALRRMHSAGVNEFILTPHIHPGVSMETDENVVKKAYENLLPYVPAGIKTRLAAEYMIVPGFEKKADDNYLLTYPDGSILIEMSYLFKSDNLEKTIFSLVMAGHKPILAHPERYSYMADNLKTFDNLIDRGCRFQMNLMSLTGAYGPESMIILKYLLDRGLYTYLATDLHSLPQMERMLSAVADKKLVEKALATAGNTTGSWR